MPDPATYDSTVDELDESVIPEHLTTESSAEDSRTVTRPESCRDDLAEDSPLRELSVTESPVEDYQSSTEPLPTLVREMGAT